MNWASVVLIPASLIVERPWTPEPSTLSPGRAAIGVFSTGFALLLSFRLVRTLGSMGVASQSYLRAGIRVLLGVLLLGEQISLMLGLGLMAIIIGVAAINLGQGLRQ